MIGVHPDLRRYTVLVTVVSLGLIIAGALLLYGAVTGSPRVEDIPVSVTLVFAAVFLVVGFVGAVLSPRWYRHATRIVNSHTPVNATVALRLESDSETTHLIADVKDIDGEPPDDTDVSMLIPRWEVEPLTGRELQLPIWCDPDTHKLLAVKTERGLIWSMPHWGHR